jgi:hypothetical protein
MNNAESKYGAEILALVMIAGLILFMILERQ